MSRASHLDRGARYSRPNHCRLKPNEHNSSQALETVIRPTAIRLILLGLRGIFFAVLIQSIPHNHALHAWFYQP